jgi:hypothetical protein|tara:strand:- start:393 stop:620 length:228 start_codon:yes stop_codon:yes gene_type:complete
MSSSENTKSTTEQINNYKHDNNASIAVAACNSLERQKDTILNNEGTDNTWFKVNERVSVNLKRDIPVIESTFKFN